MKNNKPKDQHIIPQMFLKGFTNENNKIFMFDNKNNKTSDPRNIQSVAKKKHVYTVINKQQKNFKIEEKFSAIENHAYALFKKINRTGFKDITNEEINELIDFIVLLFIRTTRSTEASEQVMQDEQVLNRMRAINCNEAERYIQACAQTKGLSYAITLAQHFEHRHKVITHNFDAYFLTAEKDAPPFILNDMFSCLEMLSTDIYKNEEGVDWGKMNVKKHFPISNKHCVSFIPKSDQDRKGTPKIKYWKSAITSGDVEIINRLSFFQKERYAYCSNKETLEKQIPT